ncbi:MAG: RNA-guided pseudouridylation complex pseudouridine synthase subunit Cbf5 [Thermoproteota archaeon]
MPGPLRLWGDPGVSGVLPVCLNDATKAIEYLHMTSKEYVGVGELHESFEVNDLRKWVEKLTGTIYQKPPVKSSVKRVIRRRTVLKFTIEDISERRFVFRVITESGTYVRKLLHDLGLLLGTGAHMVELRRVRDGFFDEESSITMLELYAAWRLYSKSGEESLLRKVVKPIEDAFKGFPSVYVKDSAVAAVAHGAPLASKGISKIDHPLSKGDTVCMKTLKGECIGFGTLVMDSDEVINAKSGIAITVDRIVMDRTLYPKMWGD